jgi:hypothetical protein
MTPSRAIVAALLVLATARSTGSSAQAQRTNDAVNDERDATFRIG